jgi:hypothetical protein
MGFHYSNLDNYAAALRGLRADADRLAASGRARLVLTENQPFGACELSTAVKGVRCKCVHTAHADSHSAATNGLVADLMGAARVVDGVYADYYGRTDAYMGAAGWNGADCLHFRPLEGLFDPFIARLASTLA